MGYAYKSEHIQILQDKDTILNLVANGKWRFCRIFE